MLKNSGQILAGIDVIGNKLTEINLTSPTGVQEIERFDGTNISEKDLGFIGKKGKEVEKEIKGYVFDIGNALD